MTKFLLKRVPHRDMEGRETTAAQQWLPVGLGGVCSCTLCILLPRVLLCTHVHMWECTGRLEDNLIPNTSYCSSFCWERASHWPGAQVLARWLGRPGKPVSVSRELGLQMCSTVVSGCLFFKHGFWNSNSGPGLQDFTDWAIFPTVNNIFLGD